MSPRIGTVMGKFSLVDGARQEQTTNMAAVKPAYGILRKRKKDSLYIILEVTGDPWGRERIYRELIRIIGEEYFQASGSVTAKLRQALGGANSFLLKENLRSLPHEQRAGGITCTVLREGNVYIAQVGPTAAHVSYQGRLSSFPKKPVAELTAEEATPLGFKRSMPIRFYRSKVGIGDAILLTSGSLAEQVSPKQIAQAIVGRDVNLALAHLEELAGEGDASAMLIRVATVGERPRAGRQTTVRQPVGPRVTETPVGVHEELPARPRIIETPTEVHEELPARPRIIETPTEVHHEELPARPRIIETPVGVHEELPARPRIIETPTEVHEELPARPRIIETPTEAPEELPARPGIIEALQERLPRPRIRESLPERLLRSGIREAVQARLPTSPRIREALRERLPSPDWDSLERKAASLLTDALRGVGDFLKRLLPERVSPPAEGRRNPWIGVAIAIAIPITIIILVIVVYWQQAASRRARFDELVAQAQQQVELVEQVDEATARGHLLEALDSLAEAEALGLSNPQMSELQTKAENTLKEIDRVIELHWIAPLWTYGDPGSDPSQVVVEGIDVYVLDNGLDRVYKHLLNDTMQALQPLDIEPVLLRKGDQRDPIVVGELVDMVWVKAEADFASESGRLGSSLLVLESGRSLLEYDPEGGIRVLPVGGSDRWVQPQTTGSYEGNFYLLDTGLNQILRHEPDYSGSPEGYFPTPEEMDLAGAVDMAIDGRVYILYADGRVLKFLGGQPEPFEITGLYVPLQNPTALFTNEETEFIYVADAGNKRIVQLTKEGRFIRQLRAGQAATFDRLKGLFALEKYNLLYFVSDYTLYVTNLPSE